MAARSIKNKLWFHYTFRHWGTSKTKADAYSDKNPSPFIYDPDTTNPGIDDGHIVSNAARVSWQVSGKDKISVYHDEQKKYRNHWGIAATIPPEASAIQVTPTSFVNVTKWTRTQTNRLLLEAGFGYLQPGIHRALSAERDRHRRQGVGRRGDSQLDGLQRHRSVEQPPRQRLEQPRRSLLDAADVHGRGVVRHRLPQLPRRPNLTNGDWRLLTAYTGDVQPITYNAGRPCR